MRASRYPVAFAVAAALLISAVATASAAAAPVWEVNGKESGTETITTTGGRSR